MPKPTKGPRLGGSPTHQRIILANLATQLFDHGRITTTETRAKRVQALAEKLITKAKRGDLHSRRLVMQTVKDPVVVHSLFAQIGPTMAKRDGGYTRITKVGNRKGDNAPMAIIELVTEEVAPKAKRSSKSTKSAEKAASTPVAAEAIEVVEAGDVVEDVADAAAEVAEDAEDAEDAAAVAEDAAAVAEVVEAAGAAAEDK